MAKYIINGGNKLTGEIKVKGAKNHVLKMIPAALLTDQSTILTNVPQILDVEMMIKICTEIGVKVNSENSTLIIDPSKIKSFALPENLVSKLRASFLFIIPLLHKFGQVIFPHPGGDAIGRRPIDMTFDFLTQMGAVISEENDSYKIKTNGLRGIDFTFKWVSVTGTEALILAAVLAKGESIIKNAAMEPEIVALGEHLNSVGARITGLGSPTLKITGVKKLGGGSCKIIPDRIEAGTFAIMGALLGDKLIVSDCDTSHLDSLWKYFYLMGINFEKYNDKIIISKSDYISATDVKTHEYPGFPTDLQPPMTLLLTQANGISMMHETIYDGRLFYTDKLNAMGANIILADPHRIIINGPCEFYGKNIDSPDVRAGITLVLAGLLSKTPTEVSAIHHVERGYENITARLQAIGADITKVE